MPEIMFLTAFFLGLGSAAPIFENTGKEFLKFNKLDEANVLSFISPKEVSIQNPFEKFDNFLKVNEFQGWRSKAVVGKPTSRFQFLKSLNLLNSNQNLPISCSELTKLTANTRMFIPEVAKPFSEVKIPRSINLRLKAPSNTPFSVKVRFWRGF